MMTQVNFDSIGGGGADYSTFFDSLTSAYQASSTGDIQYTFTVGKHYFLEYTRTGGVGVTSGATVVSDGTVDTTYFAIVEATATTIYLQGTNNKVYISQID